MYMRNVLCLIFTLAGGVAFGARGKAFTDPKEAGPDFAVQGEYVEKLKGGPQFGVQILDSFGLEGKDNECGGIYKVSPPDVNVCLPPLSWQTYDVEFAAARFDDAGNKTADAVTTIRNNGIVIHANRRLPKPTPGGGQKDEKPGALFLQDHGNPVVFRNVWVVEK